MIRLAVPSIDDSDLKAVCAVLKSGFLVQGPHVAGFEQAVADHIGAKHAVAVSNGTAALHLALVVLGVGPGDVVVTTAYSYPATANAVELCGGSPVFVDVEKGGFNLDPSHLEWTLGRVTSAGKVKAILPVHAFGQLADMPSVVDVATRFGVPVVEDAACALGATLHGRPAGLWGAMACFSFHPRKAITTGEGGMIVTGEPRYARAVRILRNHGIDPDGATPDFVAPGYNLRLTDLQAALGTSQMAKLDRIIEIRRALARGYDALLANSAIEIPRAPERSGHVYQSYVVLMPPEMAAYRDQTIRALKAQGVETTIGAYHVPLTSYYRAKGAFKPGDFPMTDDVAARAISLPMFETLTADQQRLVADMLVRLVQQGPA